MTHDYQQSHAERDRTRTERGEQASAGRDNVSAKLMAPENPVASGLLARKARDDNGVAHGAEEAVSTAASSSGSALPETLMRKFEGSLGADLSSVRIHTGGESAAAAEAVGARAYTMGQDVHFGAGQYDPSSSDGQHLIAHEVAHTVQQQGGAPHRQNKLEVSSPCDPAEHEADRAADAMVSGVPFSIGTRSGGAARRVMRELKTDWAVGAKPTIGDGVAKLAVEGSAKVEKPFMYVTLAGQLTVAGEAEVKWKPDAAGGISGKGAKGKDGKESVSLEEDVPIWTDAAHKAAHAEGDRAWTDYVAPEDLSIVLGADASDKPANEAKETARQTKGAVSVGLKGKTRSGDAWTIKLQFFELERKGKVVDVSGPGMKLGYDKKLKSPTVDVKVGDTTGKLTFIGSAKPELTIKPNWEQIAMKVAEKSAENIGREVVTTSVEAAALAGPPLLIAAIGAAAIYTAGERAQLDVSIIEGVRDAINGASVYAMIMCGQEGMPVGPISQQAAASAREELAKIAAQQHVSIDALMIALREQTTPKDFARIDQQARLRAKSAYYARVAAAVDQWRSCHKFAAFWTRSEDDVEAIWRTVEIVWH